MEAAPTPCTLVWFPCPTHSCSVRTPLGKHRPCVVPATAAAAVPLLPPEGGLALCPPPLWRPWQPRPRRCPCYRPTPAVAAAAPPLLLLLLPACQVRPPAAAPARQAPRVHAGRAGQGTGCLRAVAPGQGPHIHAGRAGQGTGCLRAVAGRCRQCRPRTSRPRCLKAGCSIRARAGYSTGVTAGLGTGCLMAVAGYIHFRINGINHWTEKGALG